MSALQRIASTAKQRLNDSPARELLLRFRHRGIGPTDCFLASYPKSGNTWLRHVLTHALTGTPTQWRDDFQQYSIMVGRHHDLIPTLPGDGRLIKTHESFRSCYPKTILMVRDPRDVAVSEYHYKRQYSSNRKLIDCNFETFLDAFINGQTSIYGNWGDHTLSWTDSIDAGVTMVLRYEDMKTDCGKQLRRALDFLGTPQSDDRIAEALSHTTAEAMRNKEKIYRDSIRGGHADRLSAGGTQASDRQFVRAAKSGGWRDYFNADTERKLIDAFATPMQQHGYAEPQW